MHELRRRVLVREFEAKRAPEMPEPVVEPPVLTTPKKQGVKQIPKEEKPPKPKIVKEKKDIELPQIEKPGRRRPVLDRIAGLVETLEKDGKFGQIDKVLRPTQRAVVRLARGEEESYIKLAEKIRIKPKRLEAVAFKLLRRLARFTEGGAFDDHYKLRAPASKKLKERLAGGETIPEIADSLGLNKTERRVLDAYLLPEVPEKIGKLTSRMKIRLATFQGALRTLCSAILYGDRTALGRRIYAKWTDEQVEAKIDRIGATTKTELFDKNPPLYYEAKARGILEKKFGTGEQIRKGVKEMKRLTSVVLERFTREQVLGFLLPKEQEVLTKVVLAEEPVGSSYFEKKYRMKTASYYTLEDQVERKLSELAGEKEQTRPVKIRVELLRIGEGANLNLTQVEQRIIRTRCTNDPKKYLTASELAEKEGVTRAGQHMREAALLRKLEEVPTPLT